MKKQIDHLTLAFSFFILSTRFIFIYLKKLPSNTSFFVSILSNCFLCIYYNSNKKTTLLHVLLHEPENLSISHQSSGPYTAFQLHLGLIWKYFYSFISHSMV